jgi:hypothetical protein
VARGVQTITIPDTKPYMDEPYFSLTMLLDAGARRLVATGADRDGNAIGLIQEPRP